MAFTRLASGVTNVLSVEIPVACETITIVSVAVVGVVASAFGTTVVGEMYSYSFLLEAIKLVPLKTLQCTRSRFVILKIYETNTIGVTVSPQPSTQETLEILEAGDELRFFEVGRHVGDEEGRRSGMGIGIHYFGL